MSIKIRSDIRDKGFHYLVICWNSLKPESKSDLCSNKHMYIIALKYCLKALLKHN